MHYPVLMMTLIILFTVQAEAGTVNKSLQVIAFTTHEEEHAKAIVIQDEGDHQGEGDEHQEKYRYRLFPSASGDSEEIQDIRIQLTRSMPSKITLLGDMSEAFEYTINDHGIVTISLKTSVTQSQWTSISQLDIEIVY